MANYRRAVRTLTAPNPRLAAVIEAGRAATNAARDSIRRDLEAGADARSLYERETDKERRIVLVGVLRRGIAALDHT